MERPPPKPISSAPSRSHQFPPRSNISIFVHALHLLDLDLLPTWPNISESTYTSSKPAQNLQARIKATEWSLYQLFRLYSPSETQSRLTLHFPASTPIQSKNLRTGLYKWLSELKTSGVLPRECVLRKTMLDECRGEKFEEVLARFAMVVLRKVIGRREGGREILRAVETQDGENILPLILAYRTSIQHHLQQRQALKEESATFSKQLAQARKTIDTSLRETQSQPAVNEDQNETPSPEKLQELRDQVDLAFSYDRRWARYIFQGSAAPQEELSTRKMPTWPFQNDEQTNSEDLGDDDWQDSVNEPVHQLQAQVSRQQENLKRLTEPRDSLLPDDADPRDEKAEIPPTKKGPDVNALKPRFNQHQELILKR